MILYAFLLFNLFYSQYNDYPQISLKPTYNSVSVFFIEKDPTKECSGFLKSQTSTSFAFVCKNNSQCVQCNSFKIHDLEPDMSYTFYNKYQMSSVSEMSIPFKTENLQIKQSYKQLGENEFLIEVSLNYLFKENFECQVFFSNSMATCKQTCPIDCSSFNVITMGYEPFNVLINSVQTVYSSNLLIVPSKFGYSSEISTYSDSINVTFEALYNPYPHNCTVKICLNEYNCSLNLFFNDCQTVQARFTNLVPSTKYILVLSVSGLMYQQTTNVITCKLSVLLTSLKLTYSTMEINIKSADTLNNQILIYVGSENSSASLYLENSKMFSISGLPSQSNIKIYLSSASNKEITSLLTHTFPKSQDAINYFQESEVLLYLEISNDISGEYPIILNITAINSINIKFYTATLVTYGRYLKIQNYFPPDVYTFNIIYTVGSKHCYKEPLDVLCSVKQKVSINILNGSELYKGEETLTIWNNRLNVSHYIPQFGSLMITRCIVYLGIFKTLSVDLDKYKNVDPTKSFQGDILWFPHTEINGADCFGLSYSLIDLNKKSEISQYKFPIKEIPFTVIFSTCTCIKCIYSPPYKSDFSANYYYPTSSNIVIGLFGALGIILLIGSLICLLCFDKQVRLLNHRTQAMTTLISTNETDDLEDQERLHTYTILNYNRSDENPVNTDSNADTVECDYDEITDINSDPLQSTVKISDYSNTVEKFIIASLPSEVHKEEYFIPLDWASMSYMYKQLANSPIIGCVVIIIDQLNNIENSTIITVFSEILQGIVETKNLKPIENGVIYIWEKKFVNEGNINNIKIFVLMVNNINISIFDPIMTLQSAIKTHESDVKYQKVVFCSFNNSLSALFSAVNQLATKLPDNILVDSVIDEYFRILNIKQSACDEEFISCLRNFYSSTKSS